MRKIISKDKICKNCGNHFNRGRLESGRIEAIEDFNLRLFCSQDCYWVFNTGTNHYLYKEGGSLTPFGYIRATDPDGSKYRGHIHRIIMSKKLGRKLNPDEHVHHKDGNPLNNDISNLELISSTNHALLHNAERKRNKKGQYA